MTAERTYDRQRAVTLPGRVMTRLQRDMERKGKAVYFQSLKCLIGGTAGSSYATAAAAMGLTESATRMAVSRLRRRYRELLREEIGRTVASEEDIDEDLRYLFVTFSG